MHPLGLKSSYLKASYLNVNSVVNLGIDGYYTLNKLKTQKVIPSGPAVILS